MEQKLPVQKGLISDVSINIDAKDLENSSGLSFDIGSTVGKIIYRSKTDYKDGKLIFPEGKETCGNCHYAMFPRSDVAGMIQYIKENADLTPNAKGELVIQASGVGGAAFKKDFENQLNCKVEILPEFDCFCNAFIALQKIIPEDELLIPLDPKIIEEGKVMKEYLTKMKAKMDEASDIKMVEVKDDIKDADRSKLLVMAGSGTIIMEIRADGSYALVGGCGTAGRFMYGLASFLSGENDFKKIVALAEKGNGGSTDMWTSDLMPVTEEGNDEAGMYAREESDIDMNIFPFGKGTTHSLAEVKKEDLCWSVMNTTAQTHAMIISAHVQIVKTKEVFFVGNTFNPELMRNMISRHKLDIDAAMPAAVEYEYKFLTNGGMYGAMGAFLYKAKEENTKC